MKLVVGLGNPGKEYARVRHNLGFMVLDQLIKEQWEENKKLKSLIIKTEDTIFAKPQTYMNNSGVAVRAIADYYKIQPEDITIVYDELDLPLGTVRVRKEGGAAGHRGVESIIEALGTDQFTRVRLGIGPASYAPEKFVLDPFTKEEEPAADNMIKQAVESIDRDLPAPLD